MLCSRTIVLCCLFIGLANANFHNIGFEKINSTHLKRPENETRKFPKDFKFGAATASYQIEGGWNSDGKIPSIWDKFVHLYPERVKNQTGDIACDSYHLWERDIEMAVELGIAVYRFSISPTRLFPYGKINPAGLRYYNNLINGLLAKGIEPLVTMFHWDLPNYIQEKGGMSDPIVVSFFESYARVLYSHFGDRVKKWITFNEPSLFCSLGYGKTLFAPGINNTIAEFACARNLLLSHAKMYHVYDKEFRHKQKGEVAITFSVMWYEPASSSKEDEMAAYRAFTLAFLQFSNPIYNKSGDWSQTMKDMLQKYSTKQGYSKSILPEFSKSEIDYIKGTSDFLGMNLYTAMLVSQSDAVEGKKTYKHSDPADATYEVDPSWHQAESAWLHKIYSLLNMVWNGIYILNGIIPNPSFGWIIVEQDVPYSMYKALQFIKSAYDNPRVFITENGWSTAGTIFDYGRVDYMRGYLNAVLDAMLDGCNVIGYCAWSLMDNFEWSSAYTEKFGLYSVDFNDPKRRRVPNLSAFVYKDIIRTRHVNPLYNPHPAKTDITSG